MAKKSKYGSKMRGRRNTKMKSKGSSKMKMPQTFNDVIRRKIGGRV
jgi:hypothetical protein